MFDRVLIYNAHEAGYLRMLLRADRKRQRRRTLSLLRKHGAEADLDRTSIPAYVQLNASLLDKIEAPEWEAEDV